MYDSFNDSYQNEWSDRFYNNIFPSNLLEIAGFSESAIEVFQIIRTPVKAKKK